MTGDERLHDLIEIWYACARDATALLRGLDEEEWAEPTDLPGWDVRAVACHLAHLESELAGNAQEQVEVPPADHVKGLMGQFTEAGPLARSSWTTDRVVDEFEGSVNSRYFALRSDPPTDPDAPGPGFAGLIGWSWQTLLTNRPFDIWMHEQDIRRATRRPGNLDSVGAAHAVGVLARSLGFVLGKRAHAPVGASLVVELTGTPDDPVALAVEIGDDGRGRPLADAPDQPTVRLRMDVETFVVLSGGRRTAEHVDVAVEGDPELAHRVLAGMAVTP
jgi:uncharacterized protein (TIGR03083 family)